MRTYHFRKEYTVVEEYEIEAEIQEKALHEVNNPQIKPVSREISKMEITDTTFAIKEAR